MKFLSSVLLVCSLFINTALAIEVGSEAPAFTLKSSEGKDINLTGYKDKIVVLEWFNQDCPFVKKHYEKGDMQALQKKWTEKGVVWLTINSTNKSNDSYRSPKQTTELIAKDKIASTAVLIDADGKVGKTYEAKTTPHMYLINKGTLLYSGAIDDNSGVFADPKEAKNYIDQSLTEVFAGQPLSLASSKPYGCSVKY